MASLSFISVVLVVKNGERRLDEVLKSLANFSEIILIDTGSSDHTLNIAKKFSNVKIFERTMEGFGRIRNEGASLASQDWILSIDADEVLTSELKDEIGGLQLESQTIYSLPFQNFFNGKWIKGCGWHPEFHIRLYNRKESEFSSDLVHEGIKIKNLKVKKLKHPVHHVPYGTVDDFLVKMDRYSRLFALQHCKKKKSSPLKAFLHGSWAFFKSYFLQKGFTLGYEGFLIARYQSDVAFYKYLKLYHANLEK